MIADFLKKYLKIQDKMLLNEIVGISRMEYFPKGTRIVQIGERQSEIFLLFEGMARGYLTNSEGKDFTDCFGFWPGTPLIGCSGLSDELPSLLNIQALSSVTALGIPVKNLRQMIEKYPEAAKIYNDCLTESLKEHFEHGIILSTLSVRERYEWFMEKYPDLLGKISCRYIASFLDMTPQTLSRERKRRRKDGEKN